MDDVLNTAHRSILVIFNTEAKEVSFVGSPTAEDDTMIIYTDSTGCGQGARWPHVGWCGCGTCADLEPGRIFSPSPATQPAAAGAMVSLYQVNVDKMCRHGWAEAEAQPLEW